jgi:hypothetical protein
MPRPDVDYLEEASVEELIAYIADLEALIIKWADDCICACGDSAAYVEEAQELGIVD